MNFKKRIILFCLWAFLVLFLIAFPTPEYEGVKITWYDKIIHIIMFGGFSYLLIYSLLESKIKNFLLILFFGLSAGILYSVLGEYIQSFVPGRTVSEYDFYAGAAGSLLFTLIAYVKFKKFKA
ncbi:MAG: VanZ family protein [Patescibacteria group bacterium]|nr:VanZ family protein [Patescibacteria group bacterium]